MFECLYSPTLKKVFIKINTVLPVEIQCNSLPDGRNLYIRATPRYSLAQFAHEIVQRCSTHMDSKDPKNHNIESHVIKHILRCSNHGSLYIGNVEIKDHLNIRTPLPQPQAGVDSVCLNYEFVCKNSCPSGMNRRSVDVIFTLEDEYGQCLGRRKLGVRICSCPKRDKEKEEQEFKEEKRNIGSEPSGKKRKLIKKPSNNDCVQGDRKILDNSVVKLPPIELLGGDIARDTVRFAHDRMLADWHRGRYEGHAEIQAKEYLEKLSVYL